MGYNETTTQGVTMKDWFDAIKQKLKSPEVQRDLMVYSSGAIAGSVAVLVYTRMKYGDRSHVLVLGKEAFNALINDETNFVRFTTDRNEHVFRVTYEH
jgi:hypothetical protein